MKRHSGFTLVELLVVIAIIGVLVALLLPAIQAAREAARRMNCGNNLKQIGLALHMYHDGKRELPAGWSGYDGGAHASKGTPGWCWATMILPFLEQKVLFESLATDDQSVTHADNVSLIQTPMSAFACSSDPREGEAVLAGHSVDMSNYVGVWGGRFEVSSGTYEDLLERMQATASSGQTEGNGALYHNSEISFRDICDGQSHTLIVGERGSKILPDDSTFYFATWAGVIGADSDYWAARVVGTGAYPPNAENSTGDGTCNDYRQGFSSHHAGGANFVLGDGSVIFVGDDIEPNIFNSLCTIDGSDSTGDFFVE